MDKDAETIVSQAEEPVPQMQTRPKRTGPKDSAHAPPLELDRSMLRLQRITDYLDAALDAPKPEVALVGGIVADLARYGVRLNQSVEDLLSECQSPREYLDAVPKGIELLLKISRQVERCARLARDLSQHQGAHDTAQEETPMPTRGKSNEE